MNEVSYPCLEMTDVQQTKLMGQAKVVTGAWNCQTLMVEKQFKINVWGFCYERWL